MNQKLYSIIRAAYTAFIVAVIPIYWHQYGPANFLWFCDITLFVVLIALWTRSNLLISMIAIGFIPLTFIWNVCFLAKLMFGNGLLGLANYMFDPTIPMYIRSISLFHIWMPALLIWLLYHWSYNNKALLWSSFFTWIVLPITYAVTSKVANINLVLGLNGATQTTLHPLLYLASYMLLIPIFIYWPMHYILKHIFKHSPRRR